jgi:hypothetical protein
LYKVAGSTEMSRRRETSASFLFFYNKQFEQIEGGIFDKPIENLSAKSIPMRESENRSVFADFAK